MTREARAGDGGSSTRSSRRSTSWLLDYVGAAVLALLIGAWAWTIAHAKTPSVALTSSAPTTAYLTDAVLGAVSNRVAKPTAPASGAVNVALGLGSALRALTDSRVITTLPFSAKQNGHIGLYYLGSWPGEHGKAIAPAKAPPGAYANPAGFIQITPQNFNTPVSPHFKLGDFVTHDQPNVWPKYIVLQQRIIDKLELVLADLQAHGVDIQGVRVMSGFRTPQYNYTGGNTAGRAENSRHMYGDASDIFIDNTGSGQMSDLNHDGRITIDDARVMLAAVDRVEAAHPELVGGAGVYTAAPGHGPFIHIDARGYRARWVGTSGG